MAEFKIDYDMGKPRDGDKDILDICKKLTEKNYITKASCGGHPESLRFFIDDSDNSIVLIDHDYGSSCNPYDPYILFKKKYDFKSLPKYWQVDGNSIRISLPNYQKKYHIAIRKATDDEIKKYGFYAKRNEKSYDIKELSDGDKIIKKMKEFKVAYIKSLRNWVDSLPALPDDSLNETVEVLTENLILNKKDLCVNIDKFENGEKNVLLITGFSGSGKSTLADELAKKYNCDYFELDSLSFYLAKHMTIDNVKSGEPALYDYIEKHNLKQEIPSNDKYDDLYRDYVKFIINWCKNKSDKKFIIEGLQIYEIYKEGDSFITSCPMIIKGTSGLVSAIRAGKRNEGPFLKEFGPLVKWAIKDNKSLEKLKNDMNNLNETTEVLNEASSSNSSKRKEITEFIVTMYNALEKGGTKNSDKFINQTKNMSDAQFIAYMTALVNDPKKHLYFEMEAFVNEPDYETVEKVANEIVGEEYTHLYDYIAFPHLSKDPKNPEYSIHKVFNGYINMRRVQQLVNNKNHIPTHISKRDPKTNQVVFESKAARVADVEQFALICHGTKNILKEFFGPRGGDPVMRDEMSRQIATTGSAQLSEMHDSKLNKTSLNTANVYLIAAGIENDMVTKNGILPRTIMNQYKEARGLDRSNVR